MLQISNHIYCDDLFNDIDIDNAILPNPYLDFPYMVIENFLSNKMLHDIVNNIKNVDNMIKAEVKIQSEYGIVDSKLNETYRKTHIYKLEKKFLRLYKKRFLQIKPKIEDYFNLILTDSTNVQVLEYEKGFFYKKHSDDSSEIVDKEGNTIGFLNIAPQRKITTVLFATTWDDTIKDDYHFDGGELLFNYLYDKDNNPIKIKPKAGDLVVFPSNPYFSHEVLKVIDGYRLTMVQWHDAMIL